MGPIWHIRMFGGLRAENARETISRFPTQRTAALLAFLALNPGIHSRETLVEAIWNDDESGPETDAISSEERVARKLARLRTALSHLRRLLEPDRVEGGSVIVATRGRVGLRSEAISTDVMEFEAAFEAAKQVPRAKARVLWTAAARIYDPKVAQLDDPETAHLDESEYAAPPRLLPGFYDDWIVDKQIRLEAIYERIIKTLEGLPDDPLVNDCDRSSETETDRGDLAPDRPPVHGLPVAFSSFYGREEEIGKIVALLDDRQRRLITLTGPGGAGKTRLAIEAIKRLEGDFPGEIWFISLADLDDPRQIPNAAADVMQIPDTRGVKTLDAIVERLGRSRTLIAFDNFEHLINGAVTVLLPLLQRAPGLTCLVTSRERLDLEGESAIEVLSLPVPTRADAPERLRQIASVRLLVDRARASQSLFQVTERNAAAIAQVCRLLEGIPLAIELAAAHAGTLSPQRMADGLLDRFTFLRRRRPVRGPRDRRRHGALWDTLAWSLDLLPEELHPLFAEVSVFRGGFTIDAVEAICSPVPGGIRNGLDQLRRRSLLTVGEAAGDIRFCMLETVREFAASRLDPHRRFGLSRLLAAFICRLMDETCNRYSDFSPSARPEQLRDMLERMRAERENLRVALEHLVASGDLESAAGLVIQTVQFWGLCGFDREANEWLERVFDQRVRLGPPWARKLLLSAAERSENRREFELARFYAQQSLEIAREEGEEEAALNAMLLIQRIEHASGNYDRACALTHEIVTACQAQERRNLLPHALAAQAEAACVQGDLFNARSLYCEALEGLKSGEHLLTAAHLRHQLAEVLRAQGDFAEARRHLESSLEIRRYFDDLAGVALCLTALGNLDLQQGRYDGARSLLEESLSMWSKEEERTAAYICLCLGQAVLLQGKLDEAQSHIEAGLPIWQDHDRWTAIWHTTLARLALYRGRLAESRRLAEDARTRVQRAQAPGSLSPVLHLLAEIAAVEGDLDRASGLLRECLILRSASGERPGIAASLEGMARVVALRGDFKSGAIALGAASALRGQIHAPLPPVDEAELAKLQDQICSFLGRTEFTKTWTSGSMLSTHAAVEWAMHLLDNSPDQR